MSIYYQDDHVTLHLGKALDVVSAMSDESVDCIVTSPPYFGLRDYGTDGQYGMEETPHEFVNNLVRLYREARRVLANDGTFWLNLGDSYASDSKWGGSTGGKHVKALHGDTSIGRGRRSTGIPNKNLIGIPWRVALALQDDGWILRNDIIWSKPNAMPESVTDRLSTRHEHLFLFTKSPKYWFDLKPIREPHTSDPGREGKNYMRGQKAIRPVGPNSGRYSEGGRNPGDVWEIATRPFSGAHFAVFPQELPRRCILAGCKPGGTVLDPCSGSGTTGAAATGNGRKYVGIDINADYLDLSLKTRLQQPVLDLGGDRMTTLTIDVPGIEWLSANQRLHWAQKSKRTRALRSRAAWLARQSQLKVPTPTIAVVEVSYPRNGTADTDNAQPTWKAICDGLVDAGALPADDSDHLAAVSFRRGPKTGVKGLYRLTLTFIDQTVPL